MGVLGPIHPLQPSCLCMRRIESQRMKILMLLAPGFHLGYLGCYGNEWMVTPTLDRLAAEGIVFDQHIADHPETNGGRLALETGAYALSGSDSRGETDGTVARDPFLACLRDHGIATVLITSRSAQAGKGSHSAWARVVEREGALEDTLAATLKVLDKIPEHQWLALVEVQDLLPPWNMPEEFRNAYADEDSDEEPEADLNVAGSLEVKEPALSEPQRAFAGMVTYFDTVLDGFLGELQQRAWAGELLLMVSSDRGQVIAEERRRSHARLHEELVHIPLILRFPDGMEASRRIRALTQPVDLLPTVFELFGLPVPETHGQSLLPLLRGTATRIRDYAVSGMGNDESLEAALRGSEWSMLLPAPQPSIGAKYDPELYLKPEDRWEVNDVRQHYLELADRLQKTLASFPAATQRAGPFIPPAIPDEETTDEQTPAQEKTTDEYRAPG